MLSLVSRNLRFFKPHVGTSMKFLKIKPEKSATLFNYKDTLKVLPPEKVNKLLSEKEQALAESLEQNFKYK
ncbi:Uncharacterised protein [Legionella beliardensis]|uniref:Uncharacterized protein n=1 Tax=Legionella beliardensis TaxID=91822 RepID=A0A378JSP3_9GAMM|nr:hypothetical protein [Legionella beliardensis]STX55608.1 Uncharacterised protein [Legionella beliardensis]